MLYTLIFALLCGLGFIALILLNYEIRRLCYARWKRLILYEFWPSTLFYFPALIYYLYLCLPYRKLGLLSIVNPGMIADGMYQAPKVKVLQSLARNPANAKLIAACQSLPHTKHSAWLSLIMKFMQQHKLNFPIVIKPQIGQRGMGVHIVTSLKQLKRVLGTMSVPQEDYMVQEHASGTEYGVLYARLPQSPQGWITSIVYKEPVYIRADGHKILKHLILGHPRACLMHHIYFRLYKEELHRVPPAGELIRLSPLGTHSLGAIFRDANHLSSKKLLESIDRISKDYRGFYLGRYDLLAKSEHDLINGSNFKIVELNSVMGEPGHIYTPGNSLWKAYAILFEHCRLAMRIAVANLALGSEPLSCRAFLLASKNAYRELL